MNRHVQFAILALLLAPTLLVPPMTGTLLAAGEPTVGVTYTFAQEMTFTFALPPGEAAREVQLYLKIDDRLTEVHALPIEEGRAIYTRSLRDEPLPPFVAIGYWWVYPTSEGTAKTAVRTFIYEDNRFRWQEATAEAITLKWVEPGEPVPAETIARLLDVATQARAEIGAELQSPQLEPVTLYVYPSPADLQLALRLSGESWVAGEARPEVGVILLAIPLHSQEAYREIERQVPHEMTHMILYRKLGADGYHHLPAWLNEGLAGYFEQYPDPTYAVALQRAVERGEILHLTTLCRPFYDLPDERVLLAYAESRSLVAYIREAYGSSAIRSLLNAYGDGMGCESGVKRTLGIDLGELERQWLKRLAQGESESRNGTTTLLRLLLLQVAPWLTLLALLSLPFLSAIIASPTRKP